MSRSDLKATILSKAYSYSEPKELLKAIRKEHPGASKKAIMHALLGTMIEAAESDEGLARRLHKAAMDGRAPD